MDKELAWHVVASAFRSTKPLQELLPLLKEHCPEAEYQDHAKAIARAIHCTQQEVIDRVFAAHPELEQQVDLQIAKYGRVN